MAGKLFTLIVLLLAAGCMPQVPAAPRALDEPTATPTQEIELQVKTAEATYTPVPTPASGFDSNECDNPFYPVSDDATWTYAISAGGKAEYRMAVDEKGAFTLNIQGDQAAFTIDGDCTNEGIVIMNTAGAATTISSSEGNTVVSTIDVKGVTLPKDIKINDQWSQTINVTTEGKKSEIFTEYTALGFENITVPAGDFYALKVEQSGYVEIFGQKVKMHGYQWFAEGVGTVKSEMDGAPAVELVTYDIPD